MLGIKNRIKKRIVDILHHRGFNTMIGQIKWHGVTGITIDEFYVKKADGSGQSVHIGKLTAKLSLWHSLIHLALQGELTAEHIRTDLRAVSDTPLLFPRFEIALRTRKNFQLVQIETGNMNISLQHSHKKSFNDFHLQFKNIVWDDIIKILKGHWLSPIIADSKSESRISLNAFFRFFPGQFLPVSHAEIKWDDFSLSSKNPANAPLKIDRNYLINIMDKKLKIVHNGQYLPFEKIPWELIDAIICSEDPRYWSHSGFCLYGLGIALRENIKTRKFSRGASTITMQVVRNIFLTHNRNLVRKVEESILALLLENYYKIEKKIILELYLNLIEFAPNVYGVQNAIRFYFDKELSELTLTEILTLTYIIPRPRHFYEALLDRTEQLRRNLHHHLLSYTHLMIKKGLIAPHKAENIGSCIHFGEKFGTLTLLDNEISSNGKQSRDIPDTINKLIRAYPHTLKEYDGQYIHLYNGQTIEYKHTDHGNGTVDPCLDVIFNERYPKGASVNTPPQNDAGRIRNQELLMKMYGGSPEEVRKNLVPIQWCPKLANQTLWCTKINMIHVRLSRISAELDQHPELAVYLNSSGIFNWRPIKGSSHLSPHSFGIAIDIAVNQAHYWQHHILEQTREFPERPQTSIPQIIVDTFEKQGFIWGGRWRHYDTMHFEYRPELFLD